MTNRDTLIFTLVGKFMAETGSTSHKQELVKLLGTAFDHGLRAGVEIGLDLKQGNLDLSEEETEIYDVLEFDIMDEETV
jgi:hypothetical protein